MTSMVLAPATQFVCARGASQNATLPAQHVQIAAEQADFQMLAQHMFSLMLRNDGSSGYEKSVRKFTWSYAAFLSAVLAKSSRRVQG